MFVPSVVLFPIVYPFRNKAYRYTEENGLLGWHPLQWCSWFFTKYYDRGDWYTGPFWFLSSLKLKYFNEFSEELGNDPIPKTFKQKLIYFYMAYRWGAIRNYMWNLSRELFEEGGLWDGLEVKDIGIIKHRLKIDEYKKSTVITPQLKYTDYQGSYSANKGKYYLFPKVHNYPVQSCTLEGIHLGKFRTVKRNKLRFNYRYAVIKNLWSYLIGVEIFQGWSYYTGWPEFRAKLNIKKMDTKALKDYREYCNSLNLKN